MGFLGEGVCVFAFFLVGRIYYRGRSVVHSTEYEYNADALCCSQMGAFFHPSENSLDHGIT